MMLNASAGLLTYAAKHYEAALRLVEKRRQAEEAVCLSAATDDLRSTNPLSCPQYVGVAREAAYNLSLVFVTTGATPLAEEVISRWLSV